MLKGCISQLNAVFDFIGVPGKIRTCDLPLRRGPRYPAAPLGQLERDFLTKRPLSPPKLIQKSEITC